MAGGGRQIIDRKYPFVLEIGETNGVSHGNRGLR